MSGTARNEKDEIEVLDSYQGLSEADLKKYVTLWNEEYPTIIDQISEHMFLRNKSKEKPRKIVLCRVRSSKELVGILIIQLDIKPPRGPWFTMIVDRKHQGKRIGAQLLEEAKQLVSELHGWVIPSNQYMKADRTPYVSPLGFYKKSGVEEGKEKIIQGKSFKVVEVVWRGSRNHYKV